MARWRIEEQLAAIASRQRAIDALRMKLREERREASARRMAGARDLRRAEERLVVMVGLVSQNFLLRVSSKS